MNTKLKNLAFIGVFVLCLVLVLLVLILTQPKAPDNEETPVADTSVYLHEGTKDDVKSIVIKNEHGEFEILQNAKGFYIPEFEGLKQNSTVMGAIGNCATKIKASALVEENAADLEKYGLSEGSPKASAFVTLKSGEQYTVYYGNTVPGSSAVYARMGGSTSVYALPSNSSNYFYYAKENLISVAITDEIANANVAPVIDRLTVTRKDLEHEIVFVDDSKKHGADEISVVSAQVMIEPVYAGLDVITAEPIVFGLWGLSATQAVVAFPTADDLRNYGIADPYCEVNLDAELQNYNLKIGNVAYYEESANGETSVPAAYYGYFKGVDAIFIFNVSQIPWVNFEIIDIISPMMTSNYIVTLDYMKIEFDNKAKTSYYYDVTGDTELAVLDVTVNGEPAVAEDFQTFYQFVLSCPIEGLCLTEPPEGAKQICFIEFMNENGTFDTLEFFDAGNNEVIIKLNGHTSFTQHKSYLNTLEKNAELLANGATSDELQMVW